MKFKNKINYVLNLDLEHWPHLNQKGDKQITTHERFFTNEIYWMMIHYITVQWDYTDNNTNIKHKLRKYCLKTSCLQLYISETLAHT